jgi:hypothetical protein
MQSETSDKRYIALIVNIIVYFLVILAGCIISLFTFFHIIMILLGMALGIGITILLNNMNKKTGNRWPHIATIFSSAYFIGFVLFTIFLRFRIYGHIL